MTDAVEARDDLTTLVARAVAAWNAMPPEQRTAMMREQRRNYVLAEMEIGSDADEAEYRAALERGDTVRMAELAAECMRRRERAERWMKENGL